MDNLTTIDLSQVNEFINPIYYKYLDNKDRYLILYGGAGSGKSYAVAQKIIIRMLEEKDHRFVCTRKVARSLRNSVFTLLKDIISDFKLTKLFKINLSDMTITFLPNGNTIYCLGLDDVEKIKSIQGISGFWHEEATEMTEKDFTQLDLRLRGKTKNYKQHILSFNPVSALHWLKKKFFDVKYPQTTILKTTYKDNLYIDDEYKNILESLSNTGMHMIYAKGEWGVLENIVFSNWEVIDSFPQGLDSVGFGLDFGFNNPTALIRCGLKDQCLYLDEELYKTHVSNGELIDYMKNNLLYPEQDAVFIADSAEPQRIYEMQQAGFNVFPCIKGQGSVHYGIGLMQSCPKIYVTERSDNLKKEFQSYSFQEDKDGNIIDEPVKFMDHGIDGGRYFYTTYIDQQDNIIGLNDVIPSFERIRISDKY